MDLAKSSQVDKGPEHLVDFGCTRQSFNNFLAPSRLLETRASINSMTVENAKFDITSITSPAAKKGYSYGLQLLESADERKLQNHQRYLRIWDKHEEHIQNHFTR